MVAASREAYVPARDLDIEILSSTDRGGSKLPEVEFDSGGAPGVAAAGFDAKVRKQRLDHPCHIRLSGYL